MSDSTHKAVGVREKKKHGLSVKDGKVLGQGGEERRWIVDSDTADSGCSQLWTFFVRNPFGLLRMSLLQHWVTLESLVPL